MCECGEARTLNQSLKRTPQRFHFSQPMSCHFCRVHWTGGHTSTLEFLINFESTVLRNLSTPTMAGIPDFYLEDCRARIQVRLRRQMKLTLWSLSEHIHQYYQYFLLSAGVYFSKLFNQTDFIHGPNLIQYNLPLFSLKTTFDPGGVISSFGCHWGNDCRRDMVVHFIRGDD